MGRLSAVVIAWVAMGCGRPAHQLVIGAPDSPPPLPATHGSPHGSDIEALAMTESAGAALTADQGGRLRLWPTLDGSREPVVIESAPAHAVALASREDELIAATIDPAGAVRVLRLGRDGRVHGQASVAGDVAARQVIAFGADILIRRVDQSIERVDWTGARQGRVAAKPGERLGAIAVRGGAALVAIITGDSGESTTVRWLELGDHLAWGRDLDMPQTISPELLALSPSRTRIAAGHPRAGREPELAIYELDKRDVKTFAMPDIDIPLGNAIGFASDDALAIAGERAPAWWVEHAVGTDKTTPMSDEKMIKRARESGPGAIGDGLAVYAYGAGLALATPNKTRYLGWRELVQMNPGDGLTYGLADGRMLWLDRELRVSHAFDTKQADIKDAFQAVPVGEHGLVVVSRHEGNERLELVDVREPKKSLTIDDESGFTGWGYEPATHVFAIATSDKVLRWKLQLEPLRVDALPAVPAPYVYQLTVLDPAKADGASLVLVEYDSMTEGQRIDLVRGKRREIQPIEGTVLATDATGIVYTRNDAEVVAYRGKKRLFRFAAPNTTAVAAISHDGKALALAHPHAVSVVDLDGHERWRREVWGPAGLAFAASDDEVVVRTTSGVVAYDAATGASITRTCGWEFGLHDWMVATTYGTPTVCEDDEQ